MYIIIHCGGLPFNGETVSKKSLGGSESAAYYMAREFAKHHEVTIFTNSKEEGTWDGVRYIYAGEIAKGYPCGIRFHQYTENTPHDILIVQRHFDAFNRKYASKFNILWLHDLALKRFIHPFTAQMWNIDLIWTVSRWHKQQIVDVLDIKPDIIAPIQNGIDLQAIKGAKSAKFEGENTKTKLFYSSRPERGLDHLVRPGGIMEKLGDDYELLVCHYENYPPSMQSLYSHLFARCNDLPNVTNVGPLAKHHLYGVMKVCDLWAYPTEFEEVSCITAMEAMACGLPGITSAHAALPETCGGSGIELIKLKDGKANEELFIESVKSFCALPYKNKKSFKNRQRRAAEQYAWFLTAEKALLTIETQLRKKNYNYNAMAKEYIYYSNIMPLLNDMKMLGNDPIAHEISNELNDCYSFTDNLQAHYEAYREEHETHPEIPEDMTGNNRYEQVALRLGDYLEGNKDCKILDYGCSYGHYTINLKKRYPACAFDGIDFVKKYIDEARRWNELEKLDCEFYCANQPLMNEPQPYDVLMLNEILEHVPSPDKLLQETVNQVLKPGGCLIITVPIGPWEALSYQEKDPYREHIWHFDRYQLKKLFQNMENYKAEILVNSRRNADELLAHYVITCTRPDNGNEISFTLPQHYEIDNPRQTLSTCIIVRDGERSLRKTLDSVASITDEIIIRIDEETTDRTEQVIEQFRQDNSWRYIAFQVFKGEAVGETGFDEARNETIDRASGDWILWIDADEELVYPERIKKYLRHNQFDSYMIEQNHFSTEPAGVMKKDYPNRLFRNHLGIRFYGVVHEHPELELNQGCGKSIILRENINIYHIGYTNEAVRRARFARNIPLMRRDREKYPERLLGKFLWMRDLSHLIKFEYEETGEISPGMLEKASEGIEIWEELCGNDKTLRMALDGLQFYSDLVRVLGKGFECGFKVDATKSNGGPKVDEQQEIKAFWLKQEHLLELHQRVMKNKIVDFEHKYF